jgi:hypothetical protein
MRRPGERQEARKKPGIMVVTEASGHRRSMFRLFPGLLKNPGLLIVGCF